MKTDRRHVAMDNLLRTALGTEAAAAGEDCPMPADVAAFVEGRLSGDERERLERHFSNCVACQETLAAIGGMPPSTGTHAVAPRVTWLSPARLRWLVPATAAAVLLVVYVASNQVPRRAVTETGAPQMAMNSKASVRATSTAQANAVTTPPNAAVAAQRTPSPRGVAKTLPGKPDAQAAGQPQQVARGEATPFTERLKVEPREEARSGKPEMVRLRAATADKSVAGDGTTPAPARPAPGPLQPVALLPPPLMTEQRAAPAPRSLALAVSADAGPGAVLVAAPDARSRWRFVPDSGIWHSADAGASWQPQAPVTSGRLVAGAAPDAVTCWAVGRDGLVMLTTDGTTWQTRTAPVRADLSGVQAHDGRTATVTAADGRRFTTTDGGVSWTAIQ